MTCVDSLADSGNGSAYLVWVVCLFVSVSKQVSELLRRRKAIVTVRLYVALVFCDKTPKWIELHGFFGVRTQRKDPIFRLRKWRSPFSDVRESSFSKLPT